MKIDELIEHLETDAEWAFANEWESPMSEIGVAVREEKSCAG